VARYSRVGSVLDSGAEGPGFKSQSRRCRVTVLGKLFTPIVHEAAKLVAALFRVTGVTAGLAESNRSLLPGLCLTSRACLLPRTTIGSGTLRSVIQYGLPLLTSRCLLLTSQLQRLRRLANCQLSVRAIRTHSDGTFIGRQFSLDRHLIYRHHLDCASS